MASNHDRDSLKESVLMNLRSVTQSLKGGVPLNCLERDYRDLLGNSIPFQKLGYTSLQSFLKDIPDVISLKNKDGQLVAEGVADSSTAHIVSLVNRQKTTKPVLRSSRRSQVLNRKGYSSRYNARSSKVTSPKYSQREYAKSSHSSYHDKRHSKPPHSIPRSKSPKPALLPEPKAQEMSSRNYEVAPRFLRLQSQKRLQRESEQSPLTFEQPKSSQNFTTNFTKELHSNNHITSPRPLLNTRSSTAKSVRLKELESAASSKEYIEIYARMNNLEVKYTTKPCGQKKDTKGFYSCLYLNEKKYCGYYICPQPAKTIKEAEEYAAKEAVETIQKDKEHLASCHETPIRSADDVQKLLSRIEEIVLEKPSGMFTNGISHEYENKYNEILPENWLQLLQQSTTLEIEHLDVPYGRIPEGVNYIVRPSRFSSGSTTPSSLSELEKAEYFEESVSRLIVRKDQLPTIPSLTIPFGNEWSVYIVDVSKLIAVRLIDYDNEFLNMSEEMKSYYKNECLPAVEISEGLLYATRDSDSDVFHRVLAQKIKDNDWVECYFVDEGVFADVLKSKLQELNTDFWKLPYQAIHMTLDGLEEYEPFMSSDDLKNLLGNVLVALVKRWTTVVDYFPDDPAVHKIIYSAVLYNTNGPEDVNVNEEIKRTVLESLAAKLPKLGTSSRAYLVHVKSTGEIFLRFLPSDESWLEIELEKFSPVFEETCLKTTTIHETKVYASKYKDGKWYRTVLIQNSGSIDPSMCEMSFIDYGFTGFLPVKQVCELESCSEFLSSLGPQAIECALFNPFPSPDSKWTPAAITELLKLAPVNQELLVRVIHEGDEENLPKVNLHKRTYQNGDSFIISINESLAFKPELFESASSKASNFLSQNSSLKLSFPNTIRPPMPRTTLSNFNNANSISGSLPLPIKPPSPANECLKWATTPDNIKSPDALEDNDLPPLKLPEVPDVGEQFDIFVTMAAHPHCFHVQPYKTINAMNELLKQMHQFYSLEENLIEMHLSLLKENNFYAVKHSDNMWYRARLQSIISTDPVSVVVSYVDFGDIVPIKTLHQLQRLWTEFRLLPCQGIKASLAGVRPVNKDWTPMQCVQFQDMVKESKFVSIVQKKHLKENHEFSVLELELTLIDVSDPKEDVYIHELLIEKGMAHSVLN